MTDSSQRIPPAADSAPAAAPPPGGRDDLLNELLGEGREFLAALRRYLTAQAGLLFARAWRGVALAAVASVALVALLGVVFTASAQLVHGLAGALAEVCGRLWAGQLCAGLLIFGMFGAGCWIALRVLERRLLKLWQAKFAKPKESR